MREKEEKLSLSRQLLGSQVRPECHHYTMGKAMEARVHADACVYVRTCMCRPCCKVR